MFSLPDLPYGYNALSPVIGQEIMELHHKKHHQGYVNKLNAAIEQTPGLKDMNLVQMLSDLESVPGSVRIAVRNHGGGHYNHSLFWQIMAPNSSGLPGGALGEAIVAKYGSYDEFVAQFDAAGLGLFGSGWVWLTRDLEILAMPNQDTPMMLGKGEPLMGLDVWEHAYYLDYKNKRDDYIKNWWQIVNWPFIEARYDN